MVTLASSSAALFRDGTIGVVIDDERSALRAATARGDAAAIRALVAKPWPPGSLQLIGEALLVALRARADVGESVDRCVSELLERGWDGDRELTGQLEAHSGRGPTPLLRPVPADLEDVVTILEGDPREGGGILNLRTGEVWPDFLFESGSGLDPEEIPDLDEDPDGWLRIDRLGSHESYQDMVSFIDTLSDERLVRRLDRAIQGRGPFRRFKDELDLWPEGDLLDRWYAFSDERQCGRARKWLAGAGYAAMPMPPR